MTNLGGGAEAHPEKLFSRKRSKGSSKRRRLLKEESVFTITDYAPKTKETRAAYEIMLNFVQRRWGCQHLSFENLSYARAGANAMLAILKNDRLLNLEKKNEIEKLLHPISDRTFRLLDSIGELLTDYQVGSESWDVTFGGEIGVYVKFEESDDDDESDCDTVGAGIGDEDMYDANESMNLNVEDIDAYWLHRRISEAYEQAGMRIDPVDCYRLSGEVLKILDEGDDADAEMKLLKLKYLGLEMFSLIKFLICNRLKIVWCTRLARAEDPVERKMVEEKMVGLGSDVSSILAELQATRASTKESYKSLERSIIEEARRLRDVGLEAAATSS